MNRHERRAQAIAYKRNVAILPDDLTLIPREDYPVLPPEFTKVPIKAWRSKRYVVQLYEEGNAVFRLSVSRSTRNTQSWVENIQWEELQDIKREVGYGDWQAIEIYPPDDRVVNVSNMRHLWLLSIPLKIGW